MINQLKTVILLGALTGLLLLVGGYFGGTTGLTIALAFSVIMNFGSYFFSDKIVLAMYSAKPVTKADNPKLHKIVEEVAEKAGIPKPKIYIIKSPNPNAFATGRGPKNAVVACTDSIMTLLNEHELKGVIAHEISHVKNRDILIATIAATIAGVISYIAQMAQFAAIFGGGRDNENSGNAFGMLAMAIITPIIAMIIQLAISRSREYLADQTGALTIKESKGLASALAKLEHGPKLTSGNTATASLFISNPFRASTLTNILSTHPATAERIKRLNALKL